MSDPAGYTVGWICALPVEYIAAQELLDEEHDGPRFVSPNDSNDYALGKMGEHNIVIAVLPDGAYGTASAANVATNMLSSFYNIRIGLMVGIGGGVPGKHDVRLGDIVVSAPFGGEGGVFQYDFGKSIQGETFQYTGFLNQPPTVLRTAIMGIRSQYKRKGHRLKECVSEVLDKNPRLKQEYKRPNPETDRLFPPGVLHTSGDCAKCADSSSKLVRRRERFGHEDDPAIHYGLIASGNTLMKDALIRDRLALEKDVLCFEMEAAGLINDFPCLVIRGICDYSDSHKNKRWQGYAAMMATAYAKDLLQRIPLNKIEAEDRIRVVISDQLEDMSLQLDRIQDQQEHQNRELMNKVLEGQKQRLYQALKVVTYSEQKNINPRRVPGTCQWALNSTEFLRWESSDCNDFLWISADPGCGKSVLARSIIDDYLEDPHSKVTICYFFFKENNEQSNLSIAICSILHQLFDKRPDLLHYAIPSWNRNGSKLPEDIDELWQIFLQATLTDSSCKTICIFDALDECSDSDQKRLVDKLQVFYRETSSLPPATCLRFLATSRPYHNIKDHFHSITQSFPHLHLKGEEENEQIHDEIDLVVKIRVKELADTIPLPADVHLRIEKQLLEMEHRTYLWLYLALEDIRTTFKYSLRPAESLIPLIPSSVKAAYKKILSRVPDDQMNTVNKILEIIVAARRPFTIQEMAMALGIATKPNSRTTTRARLDPLQLDDKIRQLCGLFIFTNNSRIYLIHQTAREFLIDISRSNQLEIRYWSSLGKAEECMGRICLQYLLMEDLVTEKDKPCSNTRDLLEYSAEHWADHIRKMTLDQEMTNQLHQIYDISKRRFWMWFPIFRSADNTWNSIPIKTVLHLAVFNGHKEEVEHLLAVDQSYINTQDTGHTYPLTWASLNGHEKIVSILIEYGADVNTQGGVYGTALQAACRHGHERIVQMLIDSGADIDARAGVLGNALQAARWGGYDKIVQILLDHGSLDLVVDP